MHLFIPESFISICYIYKVWQFIWLFICECVFPCSILECNNNCNSILVTQSNKLNWSIFMQHALEFSFPNKLGVSLMSREDQ